MRIFSDPAPLRLWSLGLFSVLLLAASLGVASQEAPAPEAPPTAAASRADTLPSDDTPLQVPEGLEAELWAESPMIYNPTNIDVDAEGRVWVIEAVDYRSFNNPDSTRMTRPQGERVVVLDDTDGDGRADSAKTFVQDDDLVAPLGIGVVGNKVYVSASPHLFVYTDTDGDLKSDKRETFLTGFGGLDHDHGLHAVTAGPGGRLYFNAGNAGPHVVTDAAGWTLRAGSIYSGGTPYMEDNHPGLESDDGRVWTGGVNLRIGPDGTGLEVMAHNFRNSYEMTVDSYGNIWNNDNDDDGNAGTRVLYAMEGGNTGYFSRDGSRSWRADKRPGQESFAAQWHQEDPGVIPAGDRTGPGAPTGIVMYEGDALGERFRGTLLSADAGRNVIYGYRPEAQGAGFGLESFSFASTLPDSVVYNQGSYDNWDPESKSYWFRPSDVAVGTDGALYVADWYDARVGGHQMQDSTGYGRIYRITPEGENLQAPEIDLSTTSGQIEALKSPAPNVRYTGFERLESKGDSAASDVKALLEADNPYHRARAVWLLAHLGPEGVREVEQVLTSPSYDAQLRAAAFRALRQVQPQEEVLKHARQLASADAPAVRREVAIFLRDVPLEESREAMVELARHYEGGADRWALEAFGMAAEGEEAATYELLKEELNVASEPAAWSDAWADLAWRLHPPASIEAFKARATAPSLSWEEKKRAMVALGFISDRKAVEAMEALADTLADSNAAATDDSSAAGDSSMTDSSMRDSSAAKSSAGADPSAADSSMAKVAERAQWWLDYRKTNEWRSLKDWAADEQTAEEAQQLEEMRALEEKIADTDIGASERGEAVQQLAESERGSRLLLSMVTDGEVPEDLKQAIRQGLSESPDQTVRVLSSHYVEPPEGREEWSAQRVASMESDAERGQMVFYARCAVCHQAGQTGGDVGPELTEVKNMFNEEGVVDAILRPSSGLAHGYYPWQVKTENGEVTYGFLLAENEGTIVLKDADGREHVIDRERITSRKRLEVSLMPGPEEMEMSKQDVADVAEFLMTFEGQGASESEDAGGESQDAGGGE